MLSFRNLLTYLKYSGNEIRYSYDENGQRIKKQTPSATEYYLCDYSLRDLSKFSRAAFIISLFISVMIFEGCVDFFVVLQPQVEKSDTLKEVKGDTLTISYPELSLMISGYAFGFGEFTSALNYYIEIESHENITISSDSIFIVDSLQNKFLPLKIIIVDDKLDEKVIIIDDKLENDNKEIVIGANKIFNIRLIFSERKDILFPVVLNIGKISFTDLNKSIYINKLKFNG